MQKFIEDTRAAGLRLVGRIVPDFDRRAFDTSGDTGWYTDPYGDVFKDGSGLCYGLVFQMSARKGQPRLVAGYAFGGCDEGGATVDFSTIYTGDSEDAYWIEYGDRSDIPVIRQAGRAADRMAKEAAEREREYQTAWAAGREWAEEKNRIETARDEFYTLNRERRLARRHIGGQATLASVCRAISEKLRSLADTVQEAKERCAELAEGDDSRLCFWPGDERLRGAFNEAAGETVLA